MDEMTEDVKSHVIRNLTSILVALFVIFGTGFVFVKIVGGARQSADAVIEEPAEATPMPLPGDIPMYKGGTVVSGKEFADGRIYEIVFSLGSINEIKAFYHTEMIKSGWQEFASGDRTSSNLKENGRRKAILGFSYYAGKVKIRISMPGS